MRWCGSILKMDGSSAQASQTAWSGSRHAAPFILVLAPKKATWTRFDTRSMDGQRLYPVIRAIVDRTRPATGPNPAKAVQSSSSVKSRLGRRPQLRRSLLANATVARRESRNRPIWKVRLGTAARVRHAHAKVLI